VGGQSHAPAALPAGKTRYTLYRRLSGHQGQSVQVRKILHPLGFDSWTVQLVASHYTDYAIPAHNKHNHTDLIYWSFTPHCYMFRVIQVSTSSHEE